MKRSSILTLVVAISCAALACGSDDGPPGHVIDGGRSTGQSGMIVDITVHGVPEYQRPLRVSFAYRANMESGWILPDTLVAHASIRNTKPVFELVSGASEWVDTLVAGETKTHGVTLRPMMGGERIFCIEAHAWVDSALTIGDQDCVAIFTLTVPWLLSGE